MADTPPTTVHKLAAEAVGTFVIVLVGCGALVASGDALTTALAFGLALVAVSAAFGRITGGHFNPAVTVASALGGRLSWNQVGLYVGAQIAGGIFGALVLFALLFGYDGYDAFEGDMGQNFFGDQSPADYAIWAAPLLELVGTAILVLVILAVTDSRNENTLVAPLVTGLTYSALILFAFQATGGSFNPARSIGPALFAGGDQLLQVWVFIVGPLLGAVIGGLAYPALFGHGTDPVTGSGLRFGSGSSKAPAYPGYAQGGYQQPWTQGDAGAQGGYDPAQQQAQQAQQYPAQQQAPQAGQPGGFQQQAPVERPIIQDGWQWDPQAQQWIPAQQAPPAAQGWAAPQQGGEQTQVRPNDGV